VNECVRDVYLFVIKVLAAKLSFLSGYTEKKKSNVPHSVYQEIQMGSVAKSYESSYVVKYYVHFLKY
jgi:hypothetical protein